MNGIGKKLASLGLTFMMALSIVPSLPAYAKDQPPNPTTKDGYSLDFADEFEGPDLDKDNWIDYYLPHWTSDPETAKANYRFENGCLVEYLVEDQKPWSPDHDGTVRSSAIMSFDKSWIHNFSGTNDNNPRDTWYGYTTTYGYFEIRAKFADCGGGGHQAWWMVGMQQDTDDWFNSKETGEIDIIESFFSKPNNWRIAAYGWNDPNFQTSWFLADEAVPDGKPTEEFHVYALDWSPKSLKFYYDNELYRTINNAPDYPMGTILNIYTDAGSGVHNNVWPKEWAIDYFRVWKKDGGYPIPEDPVVTLKNRQTGEYLYLKEGEEKVLYGDVSTSAPEAQWTLETVGDYIRLKNKLTDEYLHVEGQTGYVEHGKVAGSYWSAQWKQVPTEGYIRLANHWKEKDFIHTEDKDGFLQYGDVPSTYWTSQWEITEVAK